MPNVTVHLGSTTLFSSRAGPCAPARHSRLSAPSPLSLPPGPAHVSASAPRPGHGRLGHGRGAARRSGLGPMTAPVPRGTPTEGPHSPLLFPSQPRRRPSSLQKHGRPATRPLPHHRPRSGPPLERCLPPHRFRARTAASGHRRPLPHVGFCRAPPLSSPSPVSALRASPFPELELNLSFPFHTGAIGPLPARR
jgi:hypothetical protein